MKNLTLTALLVRLIAGCAFFEGNDADSGSQRDAARVDMGHATPEAGGTSDLTATPAGLEIYIDFDQATGSALHDLSGNGRTVTLGDGARITPQGKRGSALELPGSLDQALDFGAILDATEQLTIEVWVQAGALAGWNTLVSDFGVSDGYWLGSALGIDGAVEWRVRSSVVVCAARPLDGTWHHVAATYDIQSTPPSLVLFVDGIEDARSVLTDVREPSAPDYDLLVGAGGVGRRPFVGTLDELKIWSIVRSEEQICTDAGGRYIGGFLPTCADL